MLDKLEELKGLCAHQNFEGDLTKLFEIMLDLSLIEVKKKQTEPIKARAPKPSDPKSRNIPAHVKREVWRRCGQACAFIDPKSGRKRGSRHALEIDHIVEWSKGGTHGVENLRLLCSAHNKFRNSEQHSRLGH